MATQEELRQELIYEHENIAVLTRIVADAQVQLDKANTRATSLDAQWVSQFASDSVQELEVTEDSDETLCFVKSPATSERCDLLEGHGVRHETDGIEWRL